MVNEDHKLNNQSEQSVSGANDSNNNLDKTSLLTCVNGCSENTVFVGSITTLTTSQNLITKVSSQANKSKIKLSHQQIGTVPLTVYHQNVRGMRGKANELLSQFYDFSTYNVSLRTSHESLRITADILRKL